MATLGDIDVLTKDYSDAYNKLTDKVREVEEEIQAVKRRHSHILKKFVEEASDKKFKLQNAIESSPDLFVKPRTLQIHGIKIGFQKSKGKLVIIDEAKSVELASKKFPDVFDVLVRTEQKLVKDGLMNMSAADLAKIGVTLEETGDTVVIKAAVGDIDKLVNALLKDVDNESVSVLSDAKKAV